jgi:hypothetical protein
VGNNISTWLKNSFIGKYNDFVVIFICIMMLSNKKIALIVALIGILCDGVFSFGSGSIVSLPFPHSMTTSELNK